MLEEVWEKGSLDQWHVIRLLVERIVRPRDYPASAPGRAYRFNPDQIAR